MINLRHPLAVLATRLPWSVIQASRAVNFERKDRSGQLIEGQDMLGSTTTLVGAGRSNAGRPRMPTRLMAGLLYLKHSFNLRDEDVCERWSESPLWQFFSGQDYYEHLLPCDATQVGRFCDRLAHAPPPDGHLVKSGSGLRALALQRELSVGVAP